jgi:hypothetical protein
MTHVTQSEGFGRVSCLSDFATADRLNTMMDRKSKNKLGLSLQALLNFTDEDLLANRKGFLSERQITQLAGPTGRVPIETPSRLQHYSPQLHVLGLGIGSVLLGVVTLILNLPGGWCAIGVGAFLVLAVVMTARTRLRYLYRIMQRKQKVVALQGVPRLDTARRQGVYYPALVVRRHKLIIQAEQVSEVRDFFETTGDYPFIFYYWNPSRRVLSAEPASVEADFFFDLPPAEAENELGSRGSVGADGDL